EFTERLARHMDAGKHHKAGFAPCGISAVQEREVAIAGAGENGRSTLHQAIIVVAKDDARGEPRDKPCKAQLESAERDRARPKQVILRECKLLAHIDQGELVAIVEHRLDCDGADRTKSGGRAHYLTVSWPGSSGPA